MATGITISSTSNLSTGQKIVVAAAKSAFELASPSPDLVENERIPQGVKQWDNLVYARLQMAQALTEGVDLAENAQLVANSTSITPSEHGMIVSLSKRLIRRQGDANVVGVAAKNLATSLRIRQASDVIAIYDTFTKNIAQANSPLDITYFRGGVAYLLTDNARADDQSSTYGAAPMPLNSALHIEQISDIILDVSDPGTAAGNRPTGWGEEMLQRWWRGSARLYGVRLFNDQVILRDTSGDSKGAILNAGAIKLVMANNADATEEPDNSARITEYGIFQEWGEALQIDPHGIEVYSDTAATI